MPVKVRRERRVELEADRIQYFLTGVDHAFFWDEPERAADWAAAREDLLADWVKDHPGTRPWAWWRYDAPRWQRQSGAWFDGTLPEPRLRIGGAGRSDWERYPAIVPRLPFGIPARMVDVDPEDPPRFESEAAYLDRLGLLVPGEKRRIPAAAWEPEVVR